MAKDSYLTVRELIELLQEQDPESIVVMSKDAEGNDFRPVASEMPHSTGFFTPERKDLIWTGEFSEEEGEFSCVTLWPIN